MTTQTQTSDKPTHRIFSVSGKGKAANWTAIGAAWPNRDGQGFSITLYALPVGRTVMRASTERSEGDEAR